jgi:hypothetical protein
MMYVVLANSMGVYSTFSMQKVVPTGSSYRAAIATSNHNDAPDVRHTFSFCRFEKSTPETDHSSIWLFDFSNDRRRKGFGQHGGGGASKLPSTLCHVLCVFLTFTIAIYYYSILTDQHDVNKIMGRLYQSLLQDDLVWTRGVLLDLKKMMHDDSLELFGK